MASKKSYKANKDKKTRGERLKLTPDRDDNLQYINWFPGHMNKAMKEIKSKLKMVDLVIEVRDARVPMHSGNPALKEVLGTKAKLIFFNKENYCDPMAIKTWKKFLEERNIPYFFGNILEENCPELLLEKAKSLVLENYKNENPEGEKTKINLMAIGLPNTGKSTLINRITHKNIAKAADKPGQTRVQQWIKISDDMQILDTPGIMPPKISEYEHGLWLACIFAIPSKIVDDETSSHFLLNFLIGKYPELIQNRYELETLPTDHDETIHQIGIKRGCLLKGGTIDLERVYRIILADFRQGFLGKVCFEFPPSSK